MDTTAAVLAGLAASAFAFDLGRSHLRRPRPHAAIWATAMALYALATWALVAGLVLGWSPPVFRAFYFMGAIANIPVLAAGSVFLVAAPQRATLFLRVVIGFISVGAVAVALAPAASIPADGIPEGSDVFDFTYSWGSIVVPGPRVFAALAGGFGTLVVIGLAAASVLRSWASNRKLALGNVLIVLGVAAPAFGGTLIALGEATALAISLLAGAALLWAGYRLATAARRAQT